MKARRERADEQENYRENTVPYLYWSVRQEKVFKSRCQALTITLALGIGRWLHLVAPEGDILLIHPTMMHIYGVQTAAHSAVSSTIENLDILL